MARAPGVDLASLIHPVSPEEFKREYWERKPLVLTGRNDGRYRRLLSLADVDDLLSRSGGRPPGVRTVREGATGEPRSGPKAGVKAGGLERLYQDYRDGSTIVLDAIHERWPPLSELCRALSSEFSAAFQVNVYLTPRWSQGLPTHYDTHDVFVLQVEGSKHWRIHRSPFRLPLPGQIFRRDETEPGEVLEEFDLNAGDLAYLPRGTMHDARTEDSLSLHLTVGALTVTWASVLLAAVETAIEGDTRFRESLPAGFAEEDDDGRERAETRALELLDALRGSITPASLVDDATARALSSAPESLQGHLLDLEAESGLDLETTVRRRPEVPSRLGVDGDDAWLMFLGKVVRLPAAVEKDVRFVLESDQFTPGDLPGGLDEQGRLVLVRRLLHEGLLTLPRR